MSFFLNMQRSRIKTLNAIVLYDDDLAITNRRIYTTYIIVNVQHVFLS